jgi:hypothetical protein
MEKKYNLYFMTLKLFRKYYGVQGLFPEASGLARAVALCVRLQLLIQR